MRALSRVRKEHRVTTERTLRIISDLHVGAGVLDDCDAALEQEVSRFFTDTARTNLPTEIVINGDFLDFVQADPWNCQLEGTSADGVPLCHDIATSLEKLAHMAAAHTEIFRAAAAFLDANADNRLTILPGNHDADFFFRQVRGSFEDLVCHSNRSRQQLLFVLQQVYRPADFPHVWIEHGHQYDPTNWFRIRDESCWSAGRPPILSDRAGRQRLVECVGTRFLIRYMNRLDERYPFVDNVKPFSEFVKLFGTSAFISGYGPLAAGAAVWEMLQFIGRTTASRPMDLLTIDEQRLDPRVILAALAQHPSKAAVLRGLRERGTPLGQSLGLYDKLADDSQVAEAMHLLAENIDLLPSDMDSALLSSSEPGTLRLGRGFMVDESRELAKHAARILTDPDVALVVMGHTHEVVEPRANRQYINSGSWTRYYTPPADDRPKRWTLLRPSNIASFPFTLRYVEITLDGANLNVHGDSHGL